MKKIASIFIFFISATLHTSDPNDQRWPFYMPHTPRLCHKQRTHERNSGFDTAYRKEVGNAYLRQMIEDQKQKKQKFDNADLAKVQAKKETQEKEQNQEALKIPTPPKLPVTPRKTNPSYTHLRTPRNATDIQDLLRIQTMLPVIVQRPKITQFDIQPNHYFYTK